MAGCAPVAQGRATYKQPGGGAISTSRPLLSGRPVDKHTRPLRHVTISLRTAPPWEMYLLAVMCSRSLLQDQVHQAWGGFPRVGSRCGDEHEVHAVRDEDEEASLRSDLPAAATDPDNTPAQPSQPDHHPRVPGPPTPPSHPSSPRRGEAHTSPANWGSSPLQTAARRGRA